MLATGDFWEIIVLLSVALVVSCPVPNLEWKNRSGI
jgi:hypothetical protein